MTDPKHLLDEGSDADEFERSVLRSALDADPSETQQTEVWAGVTGVLAIVPLASSSLSAPSAALKLGGAASKAAAIWLGVGKGFIVGLAIYGASRCVAEIATHLTARARASVVLAPGGRDPRLLSTIAPSIAPQGPSPVPRLADPAAATVTGSASPVSSSAHAPNAVSATQVAPAIPARALPSVASFEAVDPTLPLPNHASQLAGETRALRAARDELRAGKLADAFATLEASRHEFSAPELYQEREALMIELLHDSGQSSAAAARAGAFLRRFPESPHAAQIRELTAR